MTNNLFLLLKYKCNKNKKNEINIEVINTKITTCINQT